MKIDLISQAINGYIEDCISGEDYEQEREELAEQWGEFYQGFNEMRALAKVLLREFIAERDCFYEGITDAEGNVEDSEDALVLANLDGRIDAYQYILSKYELEDE